MGIASSIHLQGLFTTLQPPLFHNLPFFGGASNHTINYSAILQSSIDYYILVVRRHYIYTSPQKAQTL
jgi:hypothetical protein